jgi:hypothetical protein
MSNDLQSNYIRRLTGRRRVHPIRARLCAERSKQWMFHNAERELHRIFAERDAPADERNTCACCAAPADNHPSPDPWEGRLNDYCYACALTRCDAYTHPDSPVADERTEPA